MRSIKHRCHPRRLNKWRGSRRPGGVLDYRARPCSPTPRSHSAAHPPLCCTRREAVSDRCLREYRSNGLFSVAHCCAREEVRFAGDSLVEEAVTSELVSEMPISLVTGKNTGNSAPITTRALINASQSKVLRPKFPGEETGKFSKAEQRIDPPHQGKLLRDQRKKQPTEERERDPWPICLDATPLQNLQPVT